HYNMAEDPPRTLIRESTTTLTATSIAASPARQLAAVLTIHGNLEGIAEGNPGGAGSPRPRARRRGRIYFGPCNSHAIDNGNPYGYVQNTFKDDAISSC